MDMEKKFICGSNAKFFRIIVLFFPLFVLVMYLISSLKQNTDSIILYVGIIYFAIMAIKFQHAIPLEIKTNEEGIIIRRWKKETFYSWKDVEIPLLTKLLFRLGRFDLRFLNEPIHKRYLMILGLRRKNRNELMEIVKCGIEKSKISS